MEIADFPDIRPGEILAGTVRIEDVITPVFLDGACTATECGRFPVAAGPLPLEFREHFPLSQRVEGQLSMQRERHDALADAFDFRVIRHRNPNGVLRDMGLLVGGGPCRQVAFQYGIQRLVHRFQLLVDLLERVADLLLCFLRLFFQFLEKLRMRHATHPGQQRQHQE